jgi:hypothetical protein
MREDTKRWLVAGAALAAAVSIPVTASTARADTASVIVGTVTNGEYVVRSPWGNTPVEVRVGLSPAWNGQEARAVICYRNKLNDDVGVAIPSQDSSERLTRPVRITDTVFLRSLPTETDTMGFCSSGLSGLFPGRRIHHLNTNGHIIFVDGGAGDDRVSGSASRVSVNLGAGDDVASLKPSSFMHVTSDDGSAGIDDVFSLSTTFHGETLIVGNHAHDCMTDYSGTIAQLICGGSGEHLFLLSPNSAGFAITSSQGKFCQPRIQNMPDECNDVLPEFR